MFSVRNSDIRTAWIASGAIHLAVLAIAAVLLFRQAPVDTANQIVFLVSDGKPGLTVKAQSLKVYQDTPKAENRPAILPAAQLPAVTQMKPAQAQSSAQGTPSVKREPAREPTSSGKGTIEAEFGDTSGLNFRHREIPIYPQVARRMNREGKVLLRLTIDATGKLNDLEVIEGAAFGFTEAAIDAVNKSTFIPARKDGMPVKAKAVLSVRFKLSQ
jgi:TonB family protein